MEQSTDPQFWQQLEYIIKSELPGAEKNSIFRESNCYSLFGTYKIYAKPPGYSVQQHGRDDRWFGSLKSAVSWCIAEKYRQFNLAREIEKSDDDTVRISNDIHVARAMLARISDSEYRWTAQLKLENKQAYLQQARDRLSKCVNAAKYFQIRGFNDELARTRR